MWYYYDTAVKEIDGGVKKKALSRFGRAETQIYFPK
jgi:hypothetical protein